MDADTWKGLSWPGQVTDGAKSSVEPPNQPCSPWMLSGAFRPCDCDTPLCWIMNWAGISEVRCSNLDVVGGKDRRQVQDRRVLSGKHRCWWALNTLSGKQGYRRLEAKLVPELRRGQQMELNSVEVRFQSYSKESGPIHASFLGWMSSLRMSLSLPSGVGLHP